MDLTPLPPRPHLSHYEKQAEEMLTTGVADPHLVLARAHGFATWNDFEAHIEGLNNPDSSIYKFEQAADAIVEGDADALAALLRSSPQLIEARSTRVHACMLLHYVGANGFEDYRQKSPPNAVEILRSLLSAGAAPDRLAGTYGKGTALGLIATSCHPANAGVQIPLMEMLLEAGASVNGAAGGWNPLIAALHNGRKQAAEFLAGRGATLDLEAAAGVGNLEATRGFFADGKTENVDKGLMWACQYGQTAIVDFLLTNGLDVNIQPNGESALHWAAYGGHVEIVRLLLNCGAGINAIDKRFEGTPLGWALFAWTEPPPQTSPSVYYEVVSLLVANGATVTSPEWLKSNPKINADPLMLAALRRG